MITFLENEVKSVYEFKKKMWLIFANDKSWYFITLILKSYKNPEFAITQACSLICSIAHNGLIHPINEPLLKNLMVDNPTPENHPYRLKKSSTKNFSNNCSW